MQSNHMSNQMNFHEHQIRSGSAEEQEYLISDQSSKQANGPLGNFLQINDPGMFRTEPRNGGNNNNDEHFNQEFKQNSHTP